MSELPTPAGPRVRPAVEAIPAYVPGRPVAPGAGPTYKLSSNENPYPPLPGVIEAAKQAVGVMNRYPDMAAVGLYDALADRLGAPVERLAAATGSVAVLYHLLQATCEAGDEVVYAWRSFEAYPIAVGMTGASSVQVPLTADARHDLPAMAAAVTDRTRVLIVCSPNNPTGPSAGRVELVELLDAVPRQVVVVLDEAYREFVRTDPWDGVELAQGRDNVVVLRTFSKAYGLAGLRVGFAVAPPPLAAAIRTVSLPFGVSTIAQAAAVASLAAEPALFERVDALVAERTRVLGALRTQGWDVPESDANFVWLPLGAATVDFAAACERAGVVVRPFAGEGVRVSIGEEAGNDLFLDVAASWPART
jgi:histidinol-phosphate aminotransferase